ncbi:hypothetical protein KAU93_01135 [Candidatus Bathyarchaeota archaeon]|nr:hypothetical protein [Candidatus Bathyarchaeota archaeon]
MPEKLRDLFGKQCVAILDITDLERLSSNHEKETNRFYRDQEKIKNVG